MFYRTIALAAALAGGTALPALAQSAAPQAASAPEVAKPDATAHAGDAKTPLPDTGIKKTVVNKVGPSQGRQMHHRVHKHVTAAQVR